MCRTRALQLATAAVAASCLVLGPGVARAQAPGAETPPDDPGPGLLGGIDPHVAASVSLGPSPYDLSGTGTGAAVAARLEWWALPFLALEPGLEYFGYGAQTNQTVGLLMPELSVQGSFRIGPVAPYLGVGAGYALTVVGPGDDDPTLHAAVGLRGFLPGRWGLRGELRLRSVSPFHGSMGDFTVGMSLRL